MDAVIKDKFNNAITKGTVKNPAFWVCLTLSAALIIAGFCVPPTGKIDGSVLTAVGELFGFATLEIVFIAIKKGVDANIRHGNTEVTIGDITGNEQEGGEPCE